ncbi:MAG: hypothetical protein V1778_00800 [bacterium]
MTAQSRSVGTWLTIGVFLGLSAALLFAPQQWWLGMLAGGGLAGSILLLPWLLRLLFRIIMHVVRRTRECWRTFVTAGFVLFTAALWVVIMRIAVPELFLYNWDTMSTRVALALLILGFFLTEALVIAIELACIYFNPRYRYDDYMDAIFRRGTWLGNPFFLAGYALLTASRLGRRLHHEARRSRMLALATGMAVGSLLGYLCRQPAIGMVAGGVLASIWAQRQRRVCSAR